VSAGQRGPAARSPACVAAWLRAHPSLGLDLVCGWEKRALVLLLFHFSSGSKFLAIVVLGVIRMRRVSLRAPGFAWDRFCWATAFVSLMALFPSHFVCVPTLRARNFHRLLLLVPFGVRFRENTATLRRGSV
jgi:hypothetical protein